MRIRRILAAAIATAALAGLGLTGAAHHRRHRHRTGRPIHRHAF
ncbi:hypothetical protein [Streptomyces sp. NPDC006463]